MAKDLVILLLPLAMLMAPLLDNPSPTASMAGGQDLVIEVVRAGEERIYPLSDIPLSAESGDRVEYLGDKAQPAGRMAGGKLILFGMAIDINSATVEDLIVIPGIGPKTARAIVDFRRREGKFRAIDDLIRVKGIGEKRQAEMRSYVKI